MLLKAIIILSVMILSPHQAIAQTSHGEGAYGEGVYNGSTLTSPITSSSPTTTPIPSSTISTSAGDLPITGQSLTLFASIGAVALSAGMLAWANNHRSARNSKK